MKARVAALFLFTAPLFSCSTTDPGAVVITISPGDVEIFIGSAQQLSAGSAAGVTWSSDNEQVATVVPNTGFVEAVGRGVAEITATSGNSTASVTITVLAAPTIALSQPALNFQALVGGANPAAQIATVTNAGDLTLSNLVVGAVQYGAGQPVGWLTVTPSGTTAPVTLTFNAAIGALPRGTYTATVPVLSSGVVNSPQHVAVTFVISSPASIAVSRTSVPMSGAPGVQIVELVSVTNPGDGQVAGLSTAITYSGAPGQTWLNAGISPATTPSTLTLTGNTTGLAAGSYSATVRISSTTPGVAPRDVTVALTVSLSPSLLLTPQPAVIGADFGRNPPAFPVNVTNGGGGGAGGLTGITVGAITFGAGKPGGWMTRSLNQSTSPAIVTLTVTSSALPTDNYTAIVPVVSGVASNSPQNITVNLTVRPAPIIALNPTGTINFAAWGNAASLPGAQVVQITNSGGSTLDGLSASVTSYSAGATGWLTATFNTAPQAPANLSLQPSTTGLNAGTYTAVVTVSSTAPGVASRTINVSYVVQTFGGTLHPIFVTAGCGGCHGGQSPVFSATPLTYFNNLVPAPPNQLRYIIPGDPTGSLLVCKIFGACSHNGGKFTVVQRPDIPTFQPFVFSWISAGRPFR